MPRIKVNWSLPSTAKKALVQVRDVKAGTFRTVGQFAGNQAEIKDLLKGNYEVAVSTVSASGAIQPITKAATATISLTGKATLPSGPTHFGCAQNGAYIDFKWTSPTTPNALDGVTYELRQGIAWSASNLIGDKIAGDTYRWPWEFSGTTLHFRIKAKDASGNYSGEKTADQTIAPLENYETGQDNDAVDIGWSGTHTNVEASGSGIALAMLPTFATDWTSAATDYTGVYPFFPCYPSGTYETESIDLGSTRDTRIEFKLDGEVAATTSNTAATIWTGVPVIGPDGGDDDEANPHPAQGYPVNGDDRPLAVDIDISTSTNDSDWTDPRPFVPGSYHTRYVKLRATLKTRTGFDLPTLTSFRVFERKKNRKREGGPITVTTTGVSVTFDPPFLDVPALVVRVHDSNNHSMIANLTATGADITVANIAHQDVSGIIDWIAAGT